MKCLNALKNRPDAIHFMGNRKRMPIFLTITSQSVPMLWVGVG